MLDGRGAGVRPVCWTRCGRCGAEAAQDACHGHLETVSQHPLASLQEYGSMSFVIFSCSLMYTQEPPDATVVTPLNGRVRLVKVRKRSLVKLGKGLSSWFSLGKSHGQDYEG